jgi:large subunit ribosomal protein L6
VSVTLDAAKKELVVVRQDDSKQSRAQHGTARALLANMIEGVTAGYKKSLEIQGVGYKAEAKGKNLVLSVGFANPVTLTVPTGVEMKLEGVNKIHLTGNDKQLVGQFASDIRRVRKPEPYKGKGVRYEGEQVKTKPGKAFAGAGAK